MVRVCAALTLLASLSLACSGGEEAATDSTPQGEGGAAGQAAGGGKSGSGGGGKSGSSGGGGKSGSSGQSGGSGGVSQGGAAGAGQGGSAPASGSGGSGQAGSGASSGAGGSGGSGQSGAAGGGAGGSGGSGGSGQAGGGQAGSGQSGSAAGGSGGSEQAGGGGASSGAAGQGGSDAGAGGSDAGAGGSDAGAGGSDAGAGGSGGSGQAGSGAGGMPPVDACAGQAPACPKAPAGFGEGDGLTSIDRCAFPLKEAASWSTFAPLVAALEQKASAVKLGKVLGDLNRDAVKVSAVPGSPAGVKAAFRWDSEDNDKAWWIPQGLTGSADAAASGLVEGKRVIVVSWYHDVTKQPGATDKKGVRLAFVDVTDLAKPVYRLVLLVEPTGTAANPDYKAVNIHAGGLAWFGDYLYVADTTKGFRVFDLRHILQVATDDDSIGCASGTCKAGLYKYAIPQIGAFTQTSSCAPLFSWVSLDRSSSPPTLVSGEYCSTTACSGPLAGRVFRWPLDAQTGRLGEGTSWPSAAYLMSHKQVQGGAAHEGTFFLSSSAPAGGGGALYRVKPGKSKTSGWIDSPEDLLVDTQHDWLWSLSEAEGQRYVFGAALGSYPAP